MKSFPTTTGTLAIFAIALMLVVDWAQDRIASESAPVARGASLAAANGCIDCHGKPGDPNEIVQDDDCDGSIRDSLHPNYDVECSDAIAYFEAIRLRRDFEERERSGANNALIAGEILARRYHCFQCHGQMGQGGFANTGSLKGYVPGYFGSDFGILTRNSDPESVRDWIMHGLDQRIVDRPITGWVARYFFNRQAVNMPRYKSLPPDEIDVLVGYVTALNEFGPMTAQDLRLYDERSRLIEVGTSFDVSVGQ